MLKQARFLLLTLCLLSPSSLADGTHIFEISMDTRRGPITSELRLNPFGKNSLKTAMGESEISDIQFSNNSFEFSLVAQTPMGERIVTYIGEYDSQSVSGEVIGLMGKIPFSGKRLSSSQDTSTTATTNAPEVTVNAQLPEAQSQGYLIWHRADELGNDIDNYTVLVNNNGDVVHTWQANLSGMGTTAHLLKSGGLLRMGVADRQYTRGQPVAASDQLEITDISGRPIWSIHASQLGDPKSHITFHHDLIMRPNGNILALIYERLSAADALAIGWDPRDQEYVWSDGIIEIAPDLKTGAFEVVWQWRFADHIIQDKFPKAPNYGVIAENPTLIDAHYPRNYMPLNLIRQHLNSIDYNAALDQIVISSFIYNEVWIIDRSSSELVFRFGNPAVYDHGDDDDRTLLKQHDANWIDEGLPGAGNLLLLNNNVVLTPELLKQINAQSRNPSALRVQQSIEGVSNVQEIALPLLEDGTYRKSANKPYITKPVWKFEDESFFTPFQGGARRLPNGNTLITNTVHEKVIEVSKTGKLVAEYHGSAPSYKSFKYFEIPAPLKEELRE